MSIADDIVLAAEQNKEFREFRETFKTAGVTNWPQPKEMALYFGIGAFLPGTGTIVEIGAFERKQMARRCIASDGSVAVVGGTAFRRSSIRERRKFANGASTLAGAMKADLGTLTGP